MKYVKFSQSNGIVCYGEVLKEVTWDDGVKSQLCLIRYWYDPDSDPPRRPYVLIHKDRLHPLTTLPENFTRAVL